MIKKKKRFDKRKLLEFYRELFDRTPIEEKEVIKKYGEEINSYLKRVSKSVMSPIGYNKEISKYVAGYDILKKIDQLEKQIQIEEQLEIQRQQKNFSEALVLFTGIMAFAIILNASWSVYITSLSGTALWVIVISLVVIGVAFILAILRMYTKLK